MSARQITFTYPREHLCAVNIDFNGGEYLLQWDGDWKQLPDLTTFPLVSDATVTSTTHSPRLSDIWTKSDVLKFGADAHLRELRTGADEFPICKVAIDARQRRLLRDEFSILRVLSAQSLPVVRTHSEPLIDEDGIFGFRMEKLVDIDMDNAWQYEQEIEQAVAAIHNLGIVLYDISPSNIMLDMHGRITMIDFGRAGYIGQEIPSCKVIGKDSATMTFSLHVDRLALDKTIKVLASHKTRLSTTMNEH